MRQSHPRNSGAEALPPPAVWPREAPLGGPERIGPESSEALEPAIGGCAEAPQKALDLLANLRVRTDSLGDPVYGIDHG